VTESTDQTLGQRWARRAVMVPLVLTGTALMVGLLPALAVFALAVDLVRTGTRTFSSLRVLGFLLAFLLNETLGIALLAGVFVLTIGRPAERGRLTYRIQAQYASIHLAAVTWLFSLRIVVEGEEAIVPGPLLILIRHTSIIDTVPPRDEDAGHWLPNRFVKRTGSETEREIAAVAALKDGLSSDEAVLLYPEGTRATAASRAKALGRLSGERLERAQALKHLLPVRPGGSLALLAARPSCDLLLVAHHGLEGFARITDIWAGDLIGRTVHLRFTRVKAQAVPAAPGDRLAFLDGLWAQMDAWVDVQSGAQPVEEPAQRQSAGGQR
jgi:1-acyl-sn-glycerol-3-phosphate acyltransferase